MQDGEGFTETQHTEAFGRPAINGRDLAGESMFESTAAGSAFGGCFALSRARLLSQCLLAH